MIYKILDDAGKVINRINADLDFVQQVYPGRYELEGPEPLFADPTVLSKIAMITRFTELEYAGILGAAKSDVEVQAWLDRFYSANTIDLGDSRTINGVNMMVTKGLLVPARATEILTAPVRPDEKP